MKKLVYLLAVIVCVMTVSCSDEHPISFTGHLDKVYQYEIEDTILSADSHEFTISLIGDKQPKSWNFIDAYKLEGTSIPDTINFDHLEDWEKIVYMDESTDGNISDNTYLIEGDKISLDWISFQKMSISKSPELKINVKKNESDTPRGVFIIFGERTQIGFDCAYLFIVQKPMPDMEPYTMKIRYKGKTYTTSAHLNINEEIEFDNSEFSQIMDEIDNLEKVEAIVMEDDIVDYFDMSDNNNSKAISKLRQKLAPGTRCEVRTDLPLSRAKDAYRFENADATGYFAMFDDTEFDDSYVFANLKHLTDISDQYYMRNIGLNDKVSSLAVSYKGTDPEACAVLTIWEDSFYNHGDNDRTKHRISIIATKDNPRVSMSSLKKVKCINSGNSWNDRISSYSFGFGVYDNYLKNY